MSAAMAELSNLALDAIMQRVFFFSSWFYVQCAQKCVLLGSFVLTGVMVSVGHEKRNVTR